MKHKFRSYQTCFYSIILLLILDYLYFAIDEDWNILLLFLRPLLWAIMLGLFVLGMLTLLSVRDRSKSLVRFFRLPIFVIGLTLLVHIVIPFTTDSRLILAAKRNEDHIELEFFENGRYKFHRTGVLAGDVLKGKYTFRGDTLILDEPFLDEKHHTNKLLLDYTEIRTLNINGHIDEYYYFDITLNEVGYPTRPR